MSSEVKANKLSPATGVTTTLGDASDVFQLPASAEIDIASGATLDVNGTLDLAGSTMTGFTIPSGQTLTVASGATIANSGTATGFGSSAVLRVHLLADEALAKNVSEKCKFDVEDFDTQGWYDNTTNYRFTPTVAGYYYVFTKINFAGTTQNNSCFVSIKKNTTVTAESYKTLSSGALHSFTMADTVYLNGSSDYVEVWGESGANGSPIFDAVPAYSDGDGCFMTIFKVD